MSDIRLCPSCGSEKIRKVTENWTGEWQGEFYSVPELDFYSCQNCGERIYDPPAMRKIQAYSPAYGKRAGSKFKDAA